MSAGILLFDLLETLVTLGRGDALLEPDFAAIIAPGLKCATAGQP